MSDLHITIQLSGVTPTLEKCISCCTSIHCPFCSPQIFKPTILSKMRRHLEGHKKRAVQHKDYTIFKCNLDCKGNAHFHCPCCKRLFDRRDRLLQHLVQSDSQSAGKEQDATTQQLDSDNDVKSEQEETNIQKESESEQDAGKNQDEVCKGKREIDQGACLSERSGANTCAKAPLRFTAVTSFLAPPAGQKEASPNVQLKQSPDRQRGGPQRVKCLSAAEAERACQLVACSTSQAAAAAHDHHAVACQRSSNCSPPLGNRKRAHTCDNKTESTVDEDELFLKSLLPDLKSLPKPKRAFVKFKIHELIYEAGNL